MDLFFSFKINKMLAKSPPASSLPNQPTNQPTNQPNPPRSPALIEIREGQNMQRYCSFFSIGSVMV